MHQSYDDILSRIPEAPSWFDEYAVPRFGRFHPSFVADIYAKEVALVEIGCQACDCRFSVAMSHSVMDDVMARKDDQPPTTLEQEIRDKSLSYGDPPNIRCCPAGPTMSSEPIRVLGYWRRRFMDWQEDKSLELPLTVAEQAKEGSHRAEDL